MKLGPIVVIEDATHFIVRIHPENRDRAKKISGRQWDGDRRAWVYPKNQSIYEALVAEFQKDADKFDIRRPEAEGPPGNKPRAKEPAEKFENQLLKDLLSTGDLGESRGRIHSELQQLRGLLESLKEGTDNQSRTLEELRGTQEQAAKILIQFEKSTQQQNKPEVITVVPDRLGLAKQEEIRLFERALITVASLTIGREEEKRSFLDWMTKQQPLFRATDFVNASHEFLKKQLHKIVGDENPRISFASLLEKARNLNIFYDDQSRSDSMIRPIAGLTTLNVIRNHLAHPPENFNRWERWNGSILYLMNLALIWSKVVIQTENCDE
jgi:hypothetical protein